MRAATIVTAFALILVLGSSTLPAADTPVVLKSPPAGAPTLSVGEKLYDYIYKTVRANYYVPETVDSREFGKLERDIDQEVKTPEEAIERAQKMLKTLNDPYSFLVVGNDVDKEQEVIQSTEVGRLGIKVGLKKAGSPLAETDDKGNIKIHSIDKDSPAEKAGLKQGDSIVSIDGTPVQNWDLKDVSDKLRGLKDTEVTLEIIHEGKAVEVKLQRQGFRTVAVEGYVDRKNNIGIIRILSFSNSGTALQLTRVMNKMSGVKAFIVDVRNNTGGQVPVAISMASRFLPKGRVVTLHKRVSGEVFEDESFTLTTDSMRHVIVDSRFEKPVASQETDRLPDLSAGKRVYVLVNGNSMSAAELFAGALKDNGRAELVGKKTFGKGIGQSLIPIIQKAPGLPAIELHLTTLKFLTPSGEWIGDGKGDGKGGIPVEHEVEGAKDKDSQLIAAIELLGGTFENLEQFEALNANKGGFATGEK